ncbi:putative polysaccharide biosynthesis protein [Metabacillus arenae]|uniref:Polysaccharide biosynthesis protein n=1 Tax=Metabacillus arenae TaxID=2771434 RepID=A0A926RZJ0_9BACI|nr:polysaccharide biosynthesis protein [Metabacillus arenae]MBD1383176.1 polysaccharide biosynthesis protein [Metabacillus arenae]
MQDQAFRKKSFIWQGAFVLTIAGIITKIMSAAYRVPYQNIVGDIGIYIYQQVYPFYGMAIMLATSGFPVIVSKLISDHEEDGQSAIVNILLLSFFFICGIGLLGFFILYFGAGPLAAYMGDIELKMLIQVVSFSFLLLPFISIYRGYFQGKQEMLPTAISQLTEQIIRVLTILLLSSWMLESGYGLYEAGAGALFGSLTGGFAAFSVLNLFWLRRKRSSPLSFNISSSSVTNSSILKQLFLYTVTICVSSLLLIFVQLVDALSLYSLLIFNGMEEIAAKQMKGIFDRGQPLIQLGTVVAASLSLTLVPLISSAKRKKNEALIQEKVNLSLKVCLTIGIGASAGLIAILEPVNIMLFTNNSGNNYLTILSVSILFTSLITTLTAILQGLNDTIFPAIAVVAGVVIKYGLNQLLVPQFAATGAALATVISFAAVALINVYLLRKKGYRLSDYRGIFVSLIGAAVMMITLKLYLAGFEFFIDTVHRGLAVIEALSGVFIGAFVYGWVILKGKMFTEKELIGIPIGKQLIKRSQRKEG